MKRIFILSFLCILFFGLTINASSPSTAPWSFGVMGDTQWTVGSDPANANRNGVAESIIQQLNQQFINRGVKFVIQVGDLTESGYDADIAVRAQAAKMLYDNGIGFFPMRGNHETYAAPAGSNFYGIPAFLSSFPQTIGTDLTKTFGTLNFSSPTLAGSFPNDLKGMSYSFDYGSAGNNARVVIVDDWATINKRVDAAGYPYGYSIAEQQSWIDGRLDQNSRGTMHAFVFSHQNLMGENHQDSLFNGYTNANPEMQNAFFASLQNNGVKYYVSGHDHIHQRSIITSPNGAYKVKELICASNSSKFYTPKSLTDANWFGQKRAETPISQEMYTVGFYIFTIDGPSVTVDYYSDDHGNWKSDASYPNGTGLPDTGRTPTFNFVKKETWSFSLNGQEFLIPKGGSYATVADTFETTIARILGGTNGSTAADFNLRPLTKTVNTGWTDVASWRGKCYGRFRRFGSDPASDILTLSGMIELGSNQTDNFALSMTFSNLSPLYRRGGFGLATKDDNGDWINAVDKNIGGAKKFVVGPWKSSYALGTYGIDPASNAAWAVINYNGDFAVATFDRAYIATPLNQGFEDGAVSPWAFYTDTAGSFDIDRAGNGSPHAGHVTVAQAGSNVQLYQPGITLKPNTAYWLSFSAYSKTGRDLSVSLFKHGSPYTSYGLLGHVCNLTTTWNNCSVEFTTSGFYETVNDARLMFWLAPFAVAGEEYFIDDVILKEVPWWR
jgi:hypothetical protein